MVDMAASRKTKKYSSLSAMYVFESIAAENLGELSSSTLDFLLELLRRIYSQSGNVKESSYFFQRISVATQRFNSVPLHNTLTVGIPELQPSSFLTFIF